MSINNTQNRIEGNLALAYRDLHNVLHDLRYNDRPDKDDDSIDDEAAIENILEATLALTNAYSTLTEGNNLANDFMTVIKQL